MSARQSVKVFWSKCSALNLWKNSKVKSTDLANGFGKMKKSLLRNLKVKKWYDEDDRWFPQKYRWTWKIETEDHVKSYKTSDRGEGVWVWVSNGGWKQIAGTCDFALRDMSVSGARKKLKKFFDLNDEV